MSDTQPPNPTLSQLEKTIETLRAMPSETLALLLPTLNDLVAQRDRLRNELTVDALTARDVHVGPTQITINPLSPPPPIDPAIAEERAYLKALRIRLRRIPLADAMDVSNAITLDQIYISLDVETPALVVGKAREPEESDEPLSVLGAVTRNPRSVILGQPGSGKTSFVYQLADCLAARRLGETVDAPPGFEGLLPVVMNLRDLAPRLPSLTGFTVTPAMRRQLLEAVWAQWAEDLPVAAKGFAVRLAEVLDSGMALLVFDGLDEVPENVRLRVRQAVGVVLSEYKEVAHVLVTCRSRSYAGDAVLPDMIAHTVAKFDEEKIKGFVQRWYQIQAPRRLAQSDADRRAADLTQAALGADLVDMAANPLLLTTMALVHQRDTKLPRQRVRLYDEAIKVLLQRWQDLKGIQVAASLRELLGDDLRLRRVVERLAFESHQIQSRNLKDRLTRARAIEILEDPAFLGSPGLAGDFLDYVDQRSGLFMGLGGDAQAVRPHNYDFPHRTFQEYLAGCFLLEGRPRDRARQYREKAKEGDYWSLAILYGAETLVFSRNMEKEALDLVYSLCPNQEPTSMADWRAIVWAGQMAAVLGKQAICIDDEPNGGTAFLNRLVIKLTEALRNNNLKPIERAEAGRALGKLGDARRDVIDIDAMVLRQVPAGWFWMGGPQSDFVESSDQWPLVPHHLEQGFEVGIYPVTQAQFASFIDSSDGYGSEKWWTPEGLEWRMHQAGNEHYGEPFDLPNHPVVGVSWFEAIAFCAWLTERWRRIGRLAATQTVRLPSEAEWEAAARGGIHPTQLAVTTYQPRVYPWVGELTPNHANLERAGIFTTSAVGCFALGTSEYGCEEQAGNVWEWCQTKWRDDYDHHVDLDTYEGNTRRSRRGGCYLNDEEGSRCALRIVGWPAERLFFVGFRVVVAPSIAFC